MNGATQALACNAANQITATGYTYDGAGNLTDTKHAAVISDPVTGTPLMPRTDTWTQQDTLDAPLDPLNGNRYAYAGGDPINNTDPTGRDTADCIGAGLSFVGRALSFIGSGIAFASTPGGTLASVGAGVGPRGLGWRSSSGQRRQPRKPVRRPR